LIVDRREMRTRIARLLAMLTHQASPALSPDSLGSSGSGQDIATSNPVTAEPAGLQDPDGGRGNADSTART